MKKYLAFYGQVYYPGGGMDDFVGDYDTLDEAIKQIEASHKARRGDSFLDWSNSFAHVYNQETRTEVYAK